MLNGWQSDQSRQTNKYCQDRSLSSCAFFFQQTFACMSCLDDCHIFWHFSSSICNNFLNDQQNRTEKQQLQKFYTWWDHHLCPTRCPQLNEIHHLLNGNKPLMVLLTSLPQMFWPDWSCCSQLATKLDFQHRSFHFIDGFYWVWRWRMLFAVEKLLKWQFLEQPSGIGLMSPFTRKLNHAIMSSAVVSMSCSWENWLSLLCFIFPCITNAIGMPLHFFHYLPWFRVCFLLLLQKMQKIKMIKMQLSQHLSLWNFQCKETPWSCCTKSCSCTTKWCT